jgi:hypothetical protein
MTRVSGIPAGLKIAEGTYSLSLGADRVNLGKSLTLLTLGKLSTPPRYIHPPKP